MGLNGIEKAPNEDTAKPHSTVRNAKPLPSKWDIFRNGQSSPVGVSSASEIAFKTARAANGFIP